jgi:hypothetical protein
LSRWFLLPQLEPPPELPDEKFVITSTLTYAPC